MGATSSSERSTTYRSRSVVKSKRTGNHSRGDNTYAANRDYGYEGTRDRSQPSEGVNTGSTKASSDAGYSTQSGERSNGRYNPAAINSGF